MEGDERNRNRGGGGYPTLLLMYSHSPIMTVVLAKVEI